MERKEGMKKEEDIFQNSSFSDYIEANSFPLRSIFDFSSEGEKTPLGFMELLGGVKDYMAPIATQSRNHTWKKVKSLDVFNQPATPNSSSISSASSEAVNDDEPVKVDDQEEYQQKTKQQLKLKKTNQKRKREPRIAFMTKSEVDHLEDGYKWRKYGQKAVKNNHFPRSYYRCTITSCNVKKRVERSFSDPSIVVTTYEGQHTHPSPLMSPPSLGGVHLNSSTFCQQLHQQPFANSFSPLNFGHNGSIDANFIREKRFCTSGPSLVTDHGLLQDIIPSHTLKETVD